MITCVRASGDSRGSSRLVLTVHFVDFVDLVDLMRVRLSGLQVLRMICLGFGILDFGSWTLLVKRFFISMGERSW